MHSTIAALVLASLSATTAAAELTEAEVWIADFDEAKALAEKEGKDMLVDFTGSDWCHWCIKLDEEVFEHDEFLSGVADQYVLVKLDYPNGEEAKAKVPSPERNAELAETYRIGGYPTVLLMNAAGVAYAQTGYQDGGPEAYVEHLGEIREKGRAELNEANELFEKFEAAEGDAKFEVLEKVIAKFEALDDGSFFVGHYAGMVRNALELDADNKKGLRLRAIKALLKKGEVDDDLYAAVREMDPKNEQGLWAMALVGKYGSLSSEEDVRSFVEDLIAFEEVADLSTHEAAIEIYANAAYWNANMLDNMEVAKSFAKKAKELAGTDERYNRMMGMLDEILEG